MEMYLQTDRWGVGSLVSQHAHSLPPLCGPAGRWLCDGAGDLLGYGWHEFYSSEGSV